MLSHRACLPRVDGPAIQATEEALAEVVRQRMEVRRLHNSVRARYHKLMQTASAAEISLFHSHNDGIRFIAWIFASIKVGPLLPCLWCRARTQRVLLVPEAGIGILPGRQPVLHCLHTDCRPLRSETIRRLQCSYIIMGSSSGQGLLHYT